MPMGSIPPPMHPKRHINTAGSYPIERRTQPPPQQSQQQQQQQQQHEHLHPNDTNINTAHNNNNNNSSSNNNNSNPNNSSHSNTNNGYVNRGWKRPCMYLISCIFYRFDIFNI